MIREVHYYHEIRDLGNVCRHSLFEVEEEKYALFTNIVKISKKERRN